MDRVVHFEIPADTVKRAKKFYKDVFGWKINDVPKMKYSMITTVPTDKKQIPKEPGAINGGMLKREKNIKSPVIVINTKNISKEIQKVKEHGGKIVLDKFAVGDMGFASYFKDTEGNTIGIWQNAKT